MKFSCPKCSAHYQIADEKIAGRTLKMKCRSCGVFIPIRGELSPDSLAAAPLAEAFSLAPTKIGIFPPPGRGLQLWHAGLRGVSVGPMNHEQMESRVLDGSIGTNTFVWTEGMEGWRRITEVERLADLIPLMREGDLPPSMPSRVQAARVSRPSFENGHAPKGSPPVDRTSLPHGGKAVDPNPRNSSTPSSLPVSYRPPKKKGSGALVFALFFSAVFGMSLGFVIFGGTEIQIIKEIIEVPAPGTQTPDESEEADEDADAGAPLEGASARRPNAVARKPRPGQGTAAAEPGADSTVVAEGLQGLSGLSGLSGPGSSSNVAPTKTAAANPLSESQIQATVSRGQSGVKRGCWDRALMARDKSAPTTARVSVAITVSAEGTVSGARVTGEPHGYPGLASCVSARVRGWSFPPSSGATTVNVPFVFAAQ